MIVSTRNNGALSDLPYDVALEISSVVTATGPRPIALGKLNTVARGYIQLMKAMEELTIEAAVTGDYGAALQAFTINPLVPAGTIAKELLNELLIAYKDCLQQFKDSIEKMKKKADNTNL